MRSPSRSWRLRRREGFTLVEAAVSVTLLGLIMMILYGAFQLGRGAVEKTKAQAAAGESARALPQFLASYIRSAYPYRFSSSERSFFFSGENHRLAFVSAFSVGMGGRGLSRVTLFWDEGQDGLLTVDEEIPVRPEDESVGGYRNRIVIGRGIRDFRLDYLDQEAGDERWVDRWEGMEQKALPRAVRVRYRMERGKEMDWTFPIMMRVLAS